MLSCARAPAAPGPQRRLVGLMRESAAERRAMLHRLNAERLERLRRSIEQMSPCARVDGFSVKIDHSSVELRLRIHLRKTTKIEIEEREARRLDGHASAEEPLTSALSEAESALGKRAA